MGDPSLGGKVQRIEHLMQVRRYDDAFLMSLDLISADPEATLGHQFAGWAALASGDLKASKIHLETARSLDPQDAWTLIMLGDLWVQRSDPRKVEVVARQALTIDPDLAPSLRQLAWVCLQDQDDQQAREHAGRACALDPENADSALLLSQINGLLGEGTRYDPGKRVAEFESLLQMDPENPHLHLAIGWLQLDELGDSVQARNHFAMALDLDPLDEEARQGLLEAMTRHNPGLLFLYWPRQVPRLHARLRNWAAGRWWVILATFAAALALLPLLGPLVVIWALAVWPMAAVYKYFTLSDLKRKAGFHAITPGPLRIHYWPMWVRLVVLGMLVVVFWTGLWWLRETMTVRIIAGVLLGLLIIEFTGDSLIQTLRDAREQFHNRN